MEALLGRLVVEGCELGIRRVEGLADVLEVFGVVLFVEFEIARVILVGEGGWRVVVYWV